MLTMQAARRRIAKLANYKPKPIDLDPRFPHQNAFVEDSSRYLAAQCSRRAGKTNGLAIRFFKTLEKYPKAQCLYIALTFDSARDIIWPVLQELNDKYKLGCQFVESKMVMLHPNGARLRIVGADMKNFIKRLKGRKYPGVAIDEAQDFGSHLQTLIDDVLAPSIADYVDGWLALTGTPGPVPHGYFFEATHEKQYGYSLHSWTLLDNPYMPDPKGFIEDLKAKRRWDETNPTLLREYRNRWVLDTQSLWVRYDEKLNHFQQLPVDIAWNYVLGIDVGFKDADAIAVLAWSDQSPDVYLVEELLARKQGLTELSQQIEVLQNKYKAGKLVIDEGGLGKKLAEELRRQKGLPLTAADKARKQENVDFLNDFLRLGRFKAKGSSQFAQDSYLVQIDWDKSSPDKIVIKKKPHSDIIDAVLYAFKECHAFAYEAPKAAPKPGTKEWADAQVDTMWSAAQEHFERQAEIIRRANSGGYED